MPPPYAREVNRRLPSGVFGTFIACRNTQAIIPGAFLVSKENVIPEHFLFANVNERKKMDPEPSFDFRKTVLSDRATGSRINFLSSADAEERKFSGMTF
jgi:hypothetical protein